MIEVMSWSSVSPTVLPLVGVLLGTSGTLVGQRLSSRAEMRRDAVARAAAQRAERKEAFVSYLGAAERIEQLRGRMAHSRDDRPALARTISAS
jgi:hypothetical protein